MSVPGCLVVLCVGSHIGASLTNFWVFKKTSNLSPVMATIKKKKNPHLMPGDEAASCSFTTPGLLIPKHTAPVCVFVVEGWGAIFTPVRMGECGKHIESWNVFSYELQRVTRRHAPTDSQTDTFMQTHSVAKAYTAVLSAFIICSCCCKAHSIIEEKSSIIH